VKNDAEKLPKYSGNLSPNSSTDRTAYIEETRNIRKKALSMGFIADEIAGSIQHRSIGNASVSRRKGQVRGAQEHKIRADISTCEHQTH
jgi:hypothetical protein